MRVRWSVRFSPCSLSARLSIGIRTKTPVYIPFSQVFVENPLPQRLSAPQTTPNPHHHCQSKCRSSWHRHPAVAAIPSPRRGRHSKSPARKCRGTAVHLTRVPQGRHPIPYALHQHYAHHVSDSFCAVRIHLIFSTKDRRPTISNYTCNQPEHHTRHTLDAELSILLRHYTQTREASTPTEPAPL